MPYTDDQLIAMLRDSRGTLRELDRLECRESLSSFIKRGWSQIEPSTVYKHGPHIDAISEHLEAVTDGHITRLLINVPPGTLKEIWVDEPVLTKRGRIRLGDVVEGDEILTHKGRYRRVTGVHDKGQQPTLDIKTFGGRSVRAELRHPFLTTRGWIEAQDLKVGDILAAVVPFDEVFDDQVTPEEARLMGYLVGDGSVTHSPSFTNADEEILADFERCAASVGWQTTRRQPPPSLRAHGMAATIIGIRGALPWLSKYGLKGENSYTKRIPSAVLRSSKKIIANFIGAYWSCDGMVRVRHAGKRGDIHLAQATTVNKMLALDIQHALLRLGVNSRVRRKEVKLDSKKQPGGMYVSYNIISSSHEDAAKFFDMPGLLARKNMPLEMLTLQRFIQGPLVEDQIVEIEAAGEHECRCLTVDEDHSFTAGDIAVHNSLSTSVFWPAWEWGPRQMPGLRIIGTSYSERYATRDNGRMRNLVSSEWYQERWGDQVNLTKFGERKFENTAYGWREAIPFASLTAGRGDRLIIDDPHSTESAESDAERETTIRIFLESVPTRLNDPEKSAIVIIMQRLHEEDVSGAALAHDLGYVHLMLPMEYDPSRHCTTYLPDTGEKLFEDWRTKDRELLFPDRFPRQVIEGYRSSMGPYAFAGQMQQMPVPRGGGIFHWDWWQLWGNPDDSEDERFKRFPAMEYVVASLDSAYTEKEENDYSALTLWGVFRDDGRIEAAMDNPARVTANSGMSRMAQNRLTNAPKVMLMTAWQARLPLHELVERVAKTCNRFKVDRLLIEAKASGISVGQEIKRLHAGAGWGVQLIDPGRQDKVARAYSVQHVFADLMVFAPDREWAEMVQSQMATFPKTAHKDLTDSATQAIRHLRDIGLLQHNAEIERDRQADMAYKSNTTQPLYPV